MKLLDALQQVKEPEITEKTVWNHVPPIDTLTSELNAADIWEYDEHEVVKRLCVYTLFEWMCTDTRVGLRALYFDGEPVAAIYQRGRKSALSIRWVSQEKAEQVRGYLLTLSGQETVDSVAVIGDDEEVDEKELSYLAGRPCELEVGL